MDQLVTMEIVLAVTGERTRAREYGDTLAEKCRELGLEVEGLIIRTAPVQPEEPE